MLNRHFLRGKVLQELYAYYISQDCDEKQHEKMLLDCINKLYNLQIYLLSSLLEIRDIAENQIEDAKNKFFPTEEEKQPNTKFIHNPIFKLLEENKTLVDSIKEIHINWREERDLLKNIFNKFKKSDSYNTYMHKENSDFEDDKKIVYQLFKNYVIKNESLYELLCEKEISWESDYDYVCQVVLKYLKYLKSAEQIEQIKQEGQEDADINELPKPFNKINDNQIETDEQFTKNLFYNTISHSDEYEPLIKNRIEHWDRDRLAFLDVLIIKMAMSEFIYSPIIPIRVTLNEYIELSKEFSTEKSKLFVNGLLDKLVVDLRVSGKIQKIKTSEENSNQDNITE